MSDQPPTDPPQPEPRANLPAPPEPPEPPAHHDYARHTGARVLADKTLLNRICKDLVSGIPLKPICKRYGLSINTMCAVMAQLESSGRLEPYRQRVSKRLSSVVELAAEDCLDRLEKGKLPAKVLPIMLGVAFDKKALLDGQATQNIEVHHIVEGGPDAFARRLEQLKKAKVTPSVIDVSDENKPN